MDKVAILIFLFATIYYVFFLLDPFKEQPRNRNSKKLLDNPRFLLTNTIISLLLLLIGLVKFQYGDKGALLFSPMPFLFITTYLLANLMTKKYYKKQLILLLRGDSLKGHPVLEIVISFLVLIIPLAVPIIFFLV